MSLQDLCLNIIVKHFEEYHKLFRTTEDANVKQRFEFLQRKYSCEIATRLRRSQRSLQEHYLDFLVNNYVKELDTISLLRCTSSGVYSKFAEIGVNLVKVIFQPIGCRDDKKPWKSNPIHWQNVMCHCPNLESIIFEGDFEYVVFESIAKYCPNIIEIDARDGCIFGDWIKVLTLNEGGKVPFSKLKKLFFGPSTFPFEEDSVREKVMKHLLTNLPSLEETDYKYLSRLLYIMHKDDLSALDKVQPYKLVSLDLLKIEKIPGVEDRSLFFDVIKICLSVCPHLKSLKCPSLNEEVLKLISGLPHLEELHLENQLNSDIDINNLLKSKGCALISLTVNNYTVSSSVLAKNCTRLQQLNLNEVRFIVDDSEFSFPHLESFTFEPVTNDSSNDEAVKLFLSSSTKLESVALKNCTLKSPEMKILMLKCCENCPIKSIDLSYSTVDISLLKDIIVSCHSLKNLSLCDCDVEQGELCRLAKEMPNNPSIRFYESMIDSDDSENLDNIPYGAPGYQWTDSEERSDSDDYGNLMMMDSDDEDEDSWTTLSDDEDGSGNDCKMQ